MQAPVLHAPSWNSAAGESASSCKWQEVTGELRPPGRRHKFVTPRPFPAGGSSLARPNAHAHAESKGSGFLDFRHQAACRHCRAILMNVYKALDIL